MLMNQKGVCTLLIGCCEPNHNVKLKQLNFLSKKISRPFDSKELKTYL